MEWVSGNIYIRPNNLERVGDKTEGHTHNFDHTTIVFRGSVHVRGELPNGTVIERDFVAPAHFLVKANVLHTITALSENTVYWCVYSHRSPQGDVVEEYNGWGTSYV